MFVDLAPKKHRFSTYRMDGDKTQPMDSGKTVNFRCTCGKLLSLNTETGGTCHECHRTIPAKVLNHELSQTLAIDNSKHLSHCDFDIQATETNQELLGKSLGHFEIVSTLGSGGMGHVYRALDKSLHRYVAVKVLSKSARVGTQEVERLLQEAVAQARVNHPNIVSIYYVGKQDGEPFLAMELVPGKTLSDRMSTDTLTFFDIVHVGWQITEALRVSHELDIIHGDIKPSNILIQENGIAKLSDFGMARSASSIEDKSIGGTPNYLAPEVLSGQSPSIQSDIYALGVTLYEMSFRRRPVTLSGNSISEWARSHETTELTFPNPWPEDYPESWRELLGRMLARDPAKRFSTYEELSKALIRVAPAQSTPARSLPRVIAATIDYGMVIVAFLAIQIGSFFVSSYVSKSFQMNGIGWLSFWDSNVPWYGELLWIMFKLALTLLCFAPIVFYTLSMGYWRQSLGRALMHIRVVNQHGLRPSRRVLMGRSVLRMAWVWMLISVINLPLHQYSDLWMPVLLIGVTLFTLIEMTYMMFFGNGTSLHDRWYQTRVVIDADQQ